MGDGTGISWTDATWNPTKGCSRTAPAGSNQSGCGDNSGGGCYAEQQAGRIVRMAKGKPCAYDGLVRLTAKGYRWTGKVSLFPDALALPLSWRKPRRIFVNSMSDLFHEVLSNEEIAAVFGVMAAAPQHTFQVLTKRAKRMREWFEWASGPFADQQRGIAQAPHVFRAMLDAAYEILGKPSKPALDKAWHAHEDDVWPLPNCWIGVSVENQAAADERIPELLTTPAAIRFLSCEPLLGPVTLDGGAYTAHGRSPDWLRAFRRGDLNTYGDEIAIDRSGIDQVIAGCESGPGARACNVEWLRSLRDQCAAASVPYFLKQATDHQEGLFSGEKLVTLGDRSKRKPGRVIELPYLDGVQHKDFPNG